MEMEHNLGLYIKDRLDWLAGQVSEIKQDSEDVKTELTKFQISMAQETGRTLETRGRFEQMIKDVADLRLDMAVTKTKLIIIGFVGSVVSSCICTLLVQAYLHFKM